ncbi:MAG: adenine deaminase [Nitrospirae bacterium]|nr:adenine deaminase [Nitrospirota bacterium]
MLALESLIPIARGEAPADLVLKGGQILNVCTGEIHPGDLAIAQGRIVGWGEYEGREVVDVSGLYLAPGFIDGHLHLESSHLTPEEFARIAVARGTTAVVCDPHEIANVLGQTGIAYFLGAARRLPLDLYLMLSSCVPSTELETSGARLTAAHLTPLMGMEGVWGLGEMMNVRGVLDRDPDVLAKIRSARGKRVDGHAPGCSGKDLNAYRLAGIASDHEATSWEEGLEKLRKGFWLMIREGTTEQNLSDLIGLVTPQAARRCLLISDDRSPLDLVREGHLDATLRKTIARGLDPVRAMQLVTLNPAEYFGLQEVGALIPGHWADLVVFEGLEKIAVRRVYKRGKLVAQDGRALEAIPPLPPPTTRLNVRWGGVRSLKVPARSRKMKVIVAQAGQILTEQETHPPTVYGGEAVADPERDLLKLAVLERHHGTGNMGIGFVRGFGLRQGALASTVAHDAHNLIVVGASDAEMAAAVEAVINMEGGLAVVRGNNVLATLPLPVGGLISPQPAEEVAQAMERLLQATARLGSRLENPFMTLSFLALPVVPKLKLTDKGLVDVEQGALVPLFD